jgi:site-specific DNA-methyltransferase (adenine-specific)
MKAPKSELLLFPDLPAKPKSMAVHHSHNKDEWSTPQNFFDQLNKEFDFTLDPCSTAENKKCPRHFTRETNGLLKDWAGERVFVNPPYSQIKHWVPKASGSAADGALVVMLIVNRTDTKWFHRYIWDKTTHKPRPGVEVRFLQGRLKFSNHPDAAPFPSMVVVFRPTTAMPPTAGLGRTTARKILP